MSLAIELENGMDIDDIEEDVTMLSESAAKAKAAQDAILEEFERRKRARQIAVPTDDNKVRQKLRELDEPITLFGEGPAERRDRLRELLASMDGVELIQDQDEEMEEEKEEKEEFWTPGTDELLHARRVIANYSLRRARKRIQYQREHFDTPLKVLKSIRQELYTDLKSYVNYISQIGDDRPLSYCTFSPNSSYIATGSFGGLVKMWNVPGSDNVMVLRGHTERVGGISWHPKATLSQSKSVVNLASGAGDGSVCLWSLEQDTPLATLQGHVARVSRVEFHPSGRYLGTASFDTTWRLWDVESTTELLLQEGHSREVYCISFQCDGALAATGGLDGIGRVWDLRTGRSIMALQGHIKQILGIDFSPNGFQVATGSEDNTIKIWDLRKMKCLYTVPAHKNLVSQVKYYRDIDPDLLRPKFNGNGSDMETGTKNKSGLYLVSSSFDGTVKIWSEGDWKILKILEGHEGKIMSVDVSPDSKFIASAAYDRTFKLWASEKSNL
ncbi:WD40-repeat-containing domain protein [Paraphysoderma sedebokerense]|nr:WD40-repeat-containing domain protein [Paraphysoderma sedebokerense]